MAADPEVKPLGGGGNPEGKNQFSTIEVALSDNATEEVDNRGASASYIVRRLKRDHPEIAAALGRGEYTSARAAGIAAGIVKVPTRLEELRKTWARGTLHRGHSLSSS